MPWCPKCRSEYRPGYSICADCGTELVEQEPNASLSMPKTRTFGIKSSYIYFLCIVSIGFIANAIAMLFIDVAHEHAIVEQMTIAMLVVCFFGLFVVSLIPLANPVQILFGSILGGVALLTLLTILSIPTERTISATQILWYFVETAKFLFITSVTLTTVSVSAHRWHKNHRLRDAAELILLIAILISAPYAIKYLYDMLIQGGAIVFIGFT